MKNINFSDDIRRSDEDYAQMLAKDYKEGSKLLKDIGAAVSIFGSARFDSANFYCKEAKKLSKKLADEGFHITSGGSGGIMEAANEGAYESGKAESLGFNLFLPFEQKTNEFTTRSVTLSNFCVRKKMLIKNAVAVVAFPGGFGTLDELFDTLALVQTRKMLPIKFYLYGKEFWKGLIDFIASSFVNNKTISPEDKNIFIVSDDLDEITDGIKEYVPIYMELMRNEGLDKSEKYVLIQRQLEKFKK